MSTSRIVAIYTPVQFRPPRFVVHRRQVVGPDVFELHRCLSLKQLVIDVVKILNSCHPNFQARLQDLDDQAFQKSPHKVRHYIADRRDLLYINNSYLTDKHSVKVLDSWIATNIGRKEARHIVSMACSAANVKRESLNELKL